VPARNAALRITCDTTVVIDALDGTRQAASDLFERARAGEIDVAFSPRLEYELHSHTLDEVRALVTRDIEPVGTAGRYGASRYDAGDTYAAEQSPPQMLPPTSWRLGLGTLGVDTYLGGVPGDLSTPTLDGIGILGGIDSDHLEAHRRAGRDVFVTSDLNLINAARRRGIDAVTPENLLVRVGGAT
jgi:hypothetical protein